MDQPLVELYDFIADYKASHGYSPSLEDIAGAMSITRSSVFQRLEAMENRGMIVQPRGFLRAIKLLACPKSTCPRAAQRLAPGIGTVQPLTATSREHDNAIGFAQGFSHPGMLYIVESKRRVRMRFFQRTVGKQPEPFPIGLVKGRKRSDCC
jgi:SOS-response transcriptional repressor LexA